ncbi:MAG: hypothetical protein GXY51_08950 [Bacteroidetes bacterium]|jgi:hypothetical protein|nr:hypothetical protein [Bacteroidota bacterium]
MNKGQPARIWYIYNHEGTLSTCGGLIINTDTVIDGFEFWDLLNELPRIELDCDPIYNADDKNGEWKYYWDGSALSSIGVYKNGKKRRQVDFVLR